MAERLTEKDKYGNNAIFQNKDKFTIAKDKNNDIRVYGKAIDKLAQLEDIMAKYGIESVEELDKLTDGMKSTISVLLDRNKNTKQDRDTWQKACELACDVLRDINYKIYNEDRIDFENSFYQQAKKEKESESK